MEEKQYVLPGAETLTPEQADKIHSNSLIVNHRKGEELFRQDKPISHLMFLVSGLVKIYKDDERNHSVILNIIGNNKFVGLSSVFYDSRYQFSATALENSEMVYISVPLLHEIIIENGRFALQMLNHVTNDSMDLLKKLIYYHKKQVPGRIAEVLLFFSTEIYGQNEYSLPISRQELADMVYSTKESISRTLTEFRNDRMIDIDDRKITLKSIDLLKVLSKLG
jgi:CRP-like cAMP-binding protein